jgi:hydrogenase-1 operon protein HyaF
VTRLTDIPVRVEPLAQIAVPAVGGGLGGGVAAILSELAGLLERLAGGDASATIDLRSLPMSPQDRIELQLALGEGEVRATVNAQGLSNIRETEVSGLWWVEHFDRNGQLVAEMIEVARVPQILASAFDEIAAGARVLRARISTAAPDPQGGSHASGP